ncbi:Glycine--tRNA ligase 1, mitochondrial [Metarhizium acridum]|nr:Glycine--tRNA ligase 1, mitochondrial [Metarhizium acridum]
MPRPWRTALLATSQEEREKRAKQLKDTGKISLDVAGVGDGKVEVASDTLKIEFRKRIENTREFTPNVIEPSFGIGRILYSLIEHNFWTRGSDGGDEARGVLSFPPTVAPTKVLIVPLSNNTQFRPIIKKLSQQLRLAGISRPHRRLVSQHRSELKNSKYWMLSKALVDGSKNWEKVASELPKFEGQEVEVAAR